MKKLTLLLALAIPMIAMAQLVEVSSIQKVQTPNADARMAGISPDGSYILITSQVQEGLTKIDLATKQATVLTTAPEAGFDARISADGKQVLYREMTIDSDRTTYSSLTRQDISTRETATIVKPTRSLGAYAIKGNTVLSVDKLQLRKAAISGTRVASEDVPMVSTADCKLAITRNGQTTVLTPNGADENYIWASLSPDNKRICYHVAGMGTFICNLEGKHSTLVSYDLHDAKWYNNTTLIGMEDKDNGQIITSSDIVLQSLDGTKQVLTDGSVIAVYPYASADGKRIGFSTEDGQVFVINIK